MVCCNLCKATDSIFIGCTESTKEDGNLTKNRLRRVLNYCSVCWYKRVLFFVGTAPGELSEQDFLTKEKEKTYVK